MKKSILSLLIALLIFVAGAAASLLLGATDGFDTFIIRAFRLPRTLLVLAVGGGLAVSGTAMQALSANPLADPYTMGIASAAALGTVLTLVFGGNSLSFFAPLVAFAFALLHLWILLSVFNKSLKQNPREFILTGVIFGFFFSSLTTLTLALANPQTWSFSMGWVLGAIRQTTTPVAASALCATTVLSFLVWAFWKPLDLLSIDSDLAQVSGVNTTKLRIQVFIVSSLITAVCVSAGGIIGFIGLLVPHAFRLMGVVSHKILIPGCFLSGAGLLAFSDALARVVLRPSELPVGVIMAIAGAPLFLLMLRRLK